MWRSGAPLTLIVALLAGLLVPLVAGPASAATLPVCGTGGTPSVLALQDPHFYVDTSTSPELLAGYAGYTLNAGTSARSHLWLKLDGFTGGVVGLAPGQPSAQPLPDLASGAASTQYFLLAASGTTTTAQTHTITVYDGQPATGTPVCTRTYTYSDVVDTIKALANKVSGITSSADATKPDATIGSTVTVTVAGNTGTLGAGPANDPGVLSYTPDVLADFPVSAWRLVRTELTISPDGTAPVQTYVNQLRLSGASGAARDYTARYTFRAVGPTTTNAAVQPVQYIASGTQVKHTTTPATALYSLPAVSSISDLTVRRDVVDPQSGVLGAAGGTVTHRITVSNSGSATGELDWLDETMPGGASYVPGTLTVDGQSAPAPTVVGSHVIVDGPLEVPAAGALILRFQESLDATAGPRTSSAVAYFGTSQIDGSADVLASDPVTATVRVLGAAGPTATADYATTTAGASVKVPVLGNDVSPSGLPLSVTAVSAPAHGSASIDTDGTVVYTPNKNTSGTDTFTYTVSDGYATGTGTVTVTVTPTASNDVYATGKGVTLTATTSVLANDACSSCTASLVSGPTLSGGSLTLNPDGTFTYAPPSNTAGTATFTYRATGSTGSATATATINVADIAPDYATTGNGTSVDIDVRANDPGCSSNSSCKLQAATAPGRGTADYTVAAPKVRYTPTGGEWGLDRFSYGVTGSSGSSSGPVTVLVAPPAVTMSTSVGTATTASLPGNGSCAGCSYAIGTPANHGAASINATTGALTYTPAAGFAGTDSLTYQVQDPTTGLQVTGSVNVSVSPAAGDDSYHVVAGNPLTADVTSNDACSGTCTWTLGSGAPNGLTLSTSGTLSWTPSTSTIGTTSVTYSLTSAAVASAPATGHITIDVSGAADDTATTATGTPVTIPVQANDPCGGCSVVSVGDATAGTATLNADGTITYTPLGSFSGSDGFTYTVSDGTHRDTATVTVAVTPAAVDDTLTVVQDGSAQLLPLANDPCVNCRITSVGSPGHGSAGLTGDTVTYSPASGYLGNDSFTYTLADTAGDTAQGTVAITVVAAPAVHDDTATGDAGSTFTVDVLGNDDCTGCAVTLATDPQHGAATVDVDNQVRYLPTPGYTGTDSLTYTATDPATGAQASATVDFDVRPVAVDDTAHTAVGVPVAVAVAGNDTCSGTCAVSISAGPGHGSADVEGEQVGYQPSAGYTGTDTVGYTLTDPATGDSANATLTVVVNDATPDAAATPAGQPVTVDVLANDICAGCTVTAAGGDTTYDGSSVTYTPPNGFWGLAVLPYTAGNNDGDSVSSTLRVLVAPPSRSLPVQPSQSATTTTLGTDCSGCEATLTTPPQVGEIDLSDAGATYTADSGAGTDSFGYRISDPVSGLHVDADVTVTIGDPAPAPVDDTAVAASHGGSVDIDVLANDPAGSTLGVIAAAPSHGQADIDGDQISYAPSAGYVGDDSFTYTLAGGQKTATVMVTVNASDQAITFPNPGSADLADISTVSLDATAPAGPVSYASVTPEVCTVSGHTVTLLATGACTIDASQAGGDGWNPATDVDQSFTVSRTLSPQTISFDPLRSLSLDHSSVALDPTATSGLPVTLTTTTPDVCTVGDDGTTLNLLAAGSCSLTASQDGDTYYAPADPVSVDIQVTKVDQTIDFAAIPDTVVGAVTVAIAPTAGSQLPVEVDTDTPSVCAVDQAGDTVSLSQPGSCTLTATQPGDATYAAASPVTRTFQVTANPQTIDFATPADATYGDAPTALSASAGSGLPVGFTTSTPAVCRIDGTDAVLLDVGTCRVTGSQPGDTDWQAAPDVTRSFTIRPAPQTISASGPTTVALDADPQPLSAIATSGLPVDWQTTTQQICTVSGGDVTPVATGDCVVEATQPGDRHWSAAPPVDLHITVGSPVEHASDDSFTVPPRLAEAGPVRLDVLANDGSDLHVVAVTQPAKGTVALHERDVMFTAARGFAGTATFSYTDENSRGQRTTATVEVTVPDAQPALTVGSAHTLSGRAVRLPVRATDPNGDRLTVHVSAIAGASSATRAARGVVVTPGPRTTGRLAVTVTVTDPAGKAATARGWVLVSPRPAVAPKRWLNGVGTTVRWSPSHTGAVRYAVDVDGTVRCVTATLQCRLGEPLGPRAHVAVTALGQAATRSTRSAATPRLGRPVLLAVVHFATASARLSPAARHRIRWVGGVAARYGFTGVHAVGYTDDRGSATYNLGLSHRRAAAVVRMLHALHSRLRSVIGWKGLAEPLRPNTTSAGRAVNRRVEIWVP